MKNSARNVTARIARIGLMAALLTAGKLAISFLPNIEPVTLMILLFTLTFGADIWPAVCIFILVEGMLYGFGLWWIMYLYAWPFLAGVAFLFRKRRSPLFWAVVAALFGYGYGALCSLPYFFTGGWKVAFSWWIAGIPYDLIHGTANFILVLVLYRPLMNILARILHTPAPKPTPHPAGETDATLSPQEKDPQ